MQKKKIPTLVYSISLFLYMTFIGHVCNAQSIPPFKKGTDTAAIMRLIRSAKPMSNIDSSIATLKRAAQMSLDGDFFLGAATALCAVGSRYADQGKYVEALNCGQQALLNAQKAGDVAQQAFSFNLLGVINLFQGDYVHASDDFFKALDVLKTIDSTNYRAALNVYTNMVAVSNRLGQKDKVLYYLNKGETLARDSSITHGKAVVLLAGILINKGNYYERNLLPDSALIYYNEVLALTNKMGDANNSSRIRFEALTKINLGAVFLQTHEYERAVSSCNAGITLAQGRFAFIVVQGYYTLADALRSMKKYKEAETVLLKALKENAASNTKDETILGYVTLVKVYKDTKQFEKALQYSDSITAIKDTLMSAEKTKAVAQVEARYNNAEKDRQIVRNELLIAKQQSNLAIKNLWILAIIGVVVLLAIIFGGIYYIDKHKQDSVIKSLKQENTINILKGMVQGEENERIRLAKDLHDGIGGMVSATKMRFMSLRHENESLVTSPRYLEAMGLLDILSDEVRKTSHNLMPEVLLKQDLGEALNTYCNNLQVDTSLRIDFQSFGSFSGLANDFKLNIYRIVQELLKNTLQHANATYAVVQLMMLEDYLTISVEDNGVGFNPDATKDGIGLHNLKTRVLSHEGHYTIRSEAGKGTTVYIEFAIAGSKKSGVIPAVNN